MSGEVELDAPVDDGRDYEAEARELGWHPQHEYNGPPDKWVDAKTFIQRGEASLPVLRENNRKLTGRVRQRDDENADLRNQMAEMRETLGTMRAMMQRSDEAGYQRAKRELEGQMRQAVREGDEAKFDTIKTEMEALDERHEEINAPAEPKRRATPKSPQGTPEFQAWYAENGDWVRADQTLGNAAIGFERELRNSDEVLSEAELWDRVTEMVQQKYPRRFAAATGVPLPATPAPLGDGGTPRRTAASVLQPSGGAPPSPKKGGIDAIQDPEERKAAKAAFASIRRSIPDYTEAEYMQVYVNPGADAIAPAIKRKAKANGATV